jgi:hypothetical protein
MCLRNIYTHSLTDFYGMLVPKYIYIDVALGGSP